MDSADVESGSAWTPTPPKEGKVESHSGHSSTHELASDGGVSGDGSFELVYRANFTGVFRVCLLACRDASLAEEAAQEAFVRALEHWSRLSGKPWAVGWITRTGMNFARRSLKRVPAIEVSETAESDIDFQLDLWRTIADLPRRQQEAFILYYVVDLPVSDVAAVMRCRAGTVKVHLSRARTRIQTLLKGEEDERF